MGVAPVTCARSTALVVTRGDTLRGLSNSRDAMLALLCQPPDVQRGVVKDTLSTYSHSSVDNRYNTFAGGYKGYRLGAIGACRPGTAVL